MLSHSLFAALVASVSVVDGAATGLGRRHGGDCLKPALIQSASFRTGQEEGTTGIKVGQSPSEVDKYNFINYCDGKTITNGQQLTTGTSCNGIPQGDIPAKSNMISSIILYPQPGDRIAAHTPFNVTVQTVALSAGYLVNPTTNYYTAPQQLDPATGYVLGHAHVTVQSIGSLRTMTVPDPTTFVHFKGIDDAGDGKGKLQTTITDGLPAGAYRICTMISSRNHAPVVMPVAQRGAQDDCTKFEVV